MKENIDLQMLILINKGAYTTELFHKEIRQWIKIIQGIRERQTLDEILALVSFVSFTTTKH